MMRRNDARYRLAHHASACDRETEYDIEDISFEAESTAFINGFELQYVSVWGELLAGISIWIMIGVGYKLDMFHECRAWGVNNH